MMAPKDLNVSPSPSPSRVFGAPLGHNRTKKCSEGRKTEGGPATEGLPGTPRPLGCLPAVPPPPCLQVDASSEHGRLPCLQLDGSTARRPALLSRSHNLHWRIFCVTVVVATGPIVVVAGRERDWPVSCKTGMGVSRSGLTTLRGSRPTLARCDQPLRRLSIAMANSAPAWRRSAHGHGLHGNRSIDTSNDCAFVALLHRSMRPILSPFYGSAAL